MNAASGAMPESETPTPPSDTAEDCSNKPFSLGVDDKKGVPTPSDKTLSLGIDGSSDVLVTPPHLTHRRKTIWDESFQKATCPTHEAAKFHLGPDAKGRQAGQSRTATSFRRNTLTVKTMTTDSMDALEFQVILLRKINRKHAPSDKRQL
jgi:hypothetical protein